MLTVGDQPSRVSSAEATRLGPDRHSRMVPGKVRILTAHPRPRAGRPGAAKLIPHVQSAPEEEEPPVYRRGLFSMGTDFLRLSHRMHDKDLVRADPQKAVAPREVFEVPISVRLRNRGRTLLALRYG